MISPLRIPSDVLASLLDTARTTFGPSFKLEATNRFRTSAWTKLLSPTKPLQRILTMMTQAHFQEIT